MQIEIIKVTGPISKGKYKELEVAYKKDGKVEGKKFFDFKYPEVFKILAAATEGQTFEVQTTKDDKGYWQWSSLGTDSQPASPGAEAGTSQSNSSTGRSEGASRAASAGRVTGSNYETPTERAARQRYIVRQSSLSVASELLRHNAGKNSVSPDEVIKLAKFFEGYVFNENSNPASQITDDIPV